MTAKPRGVVADLVGREMVTDEAHKPYAVVYRIRSRYSGRLRVCFGQFGSVAEACRRAEFVAKRHKRAWVERWSGDPAGSRGVEIPIAKYRRVREAGRVTVIRESQPERQRTGVYWPTAKAV